MDIYLKKEIEYNLRDKKYLFDIGYTLFSSNEIDMGTNIFLKSIKPSNSPKEILDMGCGYGPMGIILADKYPQSLVTMIDKDLLAVRYSQINAQKNNVTNTKSLGSIAMENVKDKNYDLIMSNIPAKIGEEAIEKEFILEPYEHLNPNGELWFVVMSGLNRIISQIAKKNKLSIKEVRRRKGHIVFRVMKSA